MPTGRIRPPSRNGMRQPQLSTSAAESRVLVSAATPEPSSRPAATLLCWKLPINPRRSAGAHSTMNAVEPPHSPPAEKPCSSRANTMSAAAATPMLWYVGMMPISTVPAAIRKMVSNSEIFRPLWSPIHPITMPPSGRTTKPTPNTANAASSCVTSLPEGKKFLPMTPARYAYTAKSYHSSTLPMTAAPTAWRTWISCGSCMAVSPAGAWVRFAADPGGRPLAEHSARSGSMRRNFAGDVGCMAAGEARLRPASSQRERRQVCPSIIDFGALYLRQFRSIRRGTMTLSSRLLAAFLALFLAGFGGLAAGEERRVPGSTTELSLSYAPVVQRVAPAVVNVYAAKVVENRTPFFDDPFFRRFFGGPNSSLPREQVQRSLGSGVIIDPSGLVVTNNHVVEGASEVKVALADKREFEAELVLKDTRSDLAVMRLKGARERFPALEL